MTESQPAEYLAEHLRDALAADPRTGELGLEVIPSETGVTVRGVVGSEQRRAAVLDVARETLPGVPVTNETSVKQVRGPRAEENLS